MEFKQAERKQRKARVTLVGVAGSGKTLTALVWARAFAQGGKIAVVDTERKSASLYAGEIPPGETQPLAFESLELETYEVENYLEAMRVAAMHQFPVLVIDSLTHAWIGEGGILDQKDKMGGQWNAWAKLTPKQRQLMDGILAYPGHVIVTMRAKTEYVVEKNEKGKDAPRRIGLAPQQRDNMEFEFDIFAMMDADNSLTIEKSRALSVPELRVGQIHRKPTRALADKLLAWLSSGVAEAPAAQPSLQDRVTRALTLLAEVKTQEDLNAFAARMNDPSTPSEVGAAVKSAYAAKSNELAAKPAAPAGPAAPVALSIDERIASAKETIKNIKTKAECDEFSKRMNAASTPAEIRIAVAGDFIAKASEFGESASSPAAS